MSESRHHNQARNIVEYAWRFRNHNDDIPRQYLTDILVGNIAEALRLAYATSHEKEYQDEKARRVYYQDIVYDVCNTLDRASGRSVAKGQGVVCGTKDEPHDNVQRGVKEMAATITRLSSENAALRADLARVTGERDAALAEVGRARVDTTALTHALQAWTTSEGPHTKACQEGGDSRCSACIAFECRDAVTNEAKAAMQRAINFEEAALALTPPAQQHTQGDTP